VYLGGPITGLPFKEATAWRRDQVFLDALECVGWYPLDPLTPEYDHLDDGKPLDAFFEGDPEQAVREDLAKINESRAVLFNFYKAEWASIGSSAELGYAYALGKPIISVVNEGEVHHHPFITTLSQRTVTGLGHAVTELAHLRDQMLGIPYA
jgi:nucleoside 2-deoxyribosyltransferase